MTTGPSVDVSLLRAEAVFLNADPAVKEAILADLEPVSLSYTQTQWMKDMTWHRQLQCQGLSEILLLKLTDWDADVLTHRLTDTGIYKYTDRFSISTMKHWNDWQQIRRSATDSLLISDGWCWNFFLSLPRSSHFLFPSVSIFAFHLILSLPYLHVPLSLPLLSFFSPFPPLLFIPLIFTTS